MKIGVLSAVIVGVLCTLSIGQEEEPLSVTVKAVSGSAQVRESADNPWRSIKADDVYSEGAEIRTGCRSKVDLVFADNSQVTVGRVSHFKVEKFRKSGQKVITRSKLSYGKIQAGVEKGPAVSDYKIATSMGVLGVNGTRIITLYVDPGSGTVQVSLSQEGSIGWDTGTGPVVIVLPGGSTDELGTPQDIMNILKNNVQLVDIFGATGTEIRLQGLYQNQAWPLLLNGPLLNSIRQNLWDIWHSMGEITIGQ